MATQPNNRRTYVFRCFKGELTLLSRLHWITEFTLKHAKQSLAPYYSAHAGVYIKDVLAVIDFDHSMLHEKPSAFIDNAQEYMDHFRMLLVVKGCAILEAYIHRYVHYFAVHLGYLGSKFDSISDVGEAVIKPSMVSNLYNSLRYAEKLMQINFGQELLFVKEAYQVRCAAAHNGGIIDDETAKKFLHIKEELVNGSLSIGNA